MRAEDPRPEPDIEWPGLEVLARHCTEAGLIEKAAGLWGKAGRRSLARSAFAEAIEQLSRALDQIGALPATPALRSEQIKLQVASIAPLEHEVTNSGSDRAQLANIASQAKSVLGVDSLEAVADRGYFSGEEMCLLTLTCLCCRTRKRPGKFPGLIVFKDEWRDQ